MEFLLQNNPSAIFIILTLAKGICLKLLESLDNSYRCKYFYFQCCTSIHITVPCLKQFILPVSIMEISAEISLICFHVQATIMCSTIQEIFFVCLISHSLSMHASFSFRLQGHCSFHKTKHSPEKGDSADPQAPNLDALSCDWFAVCWAEKLSDGTKIDESDDHGFAANYKILF